MTKKEQIINCMTPLVDALNKAAPQWAIFGLAALALCGMDMPVGDIDIILSRQAAQRLEQEWQKEGVVLPMNKEKSATESLFRSNLVRCNASGIMVELSGSLEILKEGRWLPVRPQKVITDSNGIRFCSLAEYKRLLKLFARPKDLLRLKEIENAYRT